MMMISMMPNDIVSFAPIVGNITAKAIIAVTPQEHSYSVAARPRFVAWYEELLRGN
jgi:hypothetical protein